MINYVLTNPDLRGDSLLILLPRGDATSILLLVSSPAVVVRREDLLVVGMVEVTSDLSRLSPPGLLLRLDGCRARCA